MRRALSKITTAWILGAIVLTTGESLATIQAPTSPGPAPAPDALAALDAELTRAEAQLTAADRDGARATLATVLGELGRLKVTRANGDRVADLFERLATTAETLDELRTAQAALSWVHTWRKRTLPEDHDDLLALKARLSAVLADIGRDSEARDLLEPVISAFGRTRSADDPGLVGSRRRLAVLLGRLGDPRGALQQHDLVYESLRRTLPDDDPQLQEARKQLAAKRYELGDYTGALVLFEQIGLTYRDEIAAGARHPDDIEAILNTANLAEVLRRAGSHQHALLIQEDVVAKLTRSLPADDPRLAQARGHLGSTLLMLGHRERPLAIARELVALFEREADGDSRLLTWARRELARAQKAHGEARQAMATELEIYALQKSRLPADHPDLQSALINLFWSAVELELSDEILKYGTLWATSARLTLRPWGLSPRALGQLAQQYQTNVASLLTLSPGRGKTAPLPGLDAEALLLVETLRGLETRAARRTRVQRRDVDPETWTDALSALLRATQEVLRVATEPIPEGTARAATLRERNVRLADAVTTKERLQRQLQELTPEDPAETTLAGLAATLPEGSVAVSFISHWLADTPGQPMVPEDQQLIAMILTPGGELTRVELGSLRTIEQHVDALLLELHNRSGRGERLGKPAERPTQDVILDRAEFLRQLVLDPLEPHLGDDTDTLFVSLDEALLSVPLDALPTATGEPYGSARTIRRVVSLVDLADSREPTAAPTIDTSADVLLAVGDVSYGPAGAASPTESSLRLSPPGGFMPLPQTGREIDGISALFAAVRKASRIERLAGARADKQRFLELAPAAKYIHLATHGYTLGEDGWGLGSDLDLFELPTPGQQLDAQRVVSLSPLSLTGLALSGANGDTGRGNLAGLLTAEELMALDLAGCQLVTLSACDTSLGVLRASQGYASLQTALLAAGARWVVSSLWVVDDEATAELMLAFYDHLWNQGLPPPEALWQAGLDMRAKNAPFSDWAGWLVVGR